jgi:hypothetical protein
MILMLSIGMLKKFMITLVLALCFPISSWAAEWNDYYIHGWHEEKSGYDFYNLSRYDDQGSEELVLLHKPGEEEWQRLDSRVKHLWRSYIYELPEAKVVKDGGSFDPRQFNPYERYYYDIMDNRLILGKQYLTSPNGKWGLQENDYYPSGQKSQNILLKNMETGRIQEWLQPIISPSYYWLPDSRVLICTYSNEEKQNVIYIFDPVTENMDKLVSGSIYAYDREKNLILFVKNEPQRLAWVMDLATRQEAREDNTDSFYDFDRVPDLPLPPQDLVLADLKVITPELVVQYQHKITVGTETIPLPYVFEKENREFVPLRPLMEPLGIKLNINKAAPNAEEYQVSYQEEKFTLAPEEYLNYQWQLFVTPEALQKLGLTGFKIRALTD